MGAVILGTGSCLPEKKLTNHDLEKMIETSDEWITSRTGIKSRRISGKGELTHILAARAGKKALEASGVSPEEIDVLIVATMSFHMIMPSCACFVQEQLGLINAYAFDINAACSGFVYSLDVAGHYMVADESKKVMVIGAETLSARVDWQDRNTCILFGDGAGAVVFGHVNDDDRGLVGSNLFSDGRLWKLLYMHGPVSSNPDLMVKDHPGSHIMMEGREVFKYAVNAMESAVRSLLEKHDIGLEAIKLVIPHQANIRILNKLLQRLGIDSTKVFVNVSHYGNTSAASIPIAIDEANRAGMIQEKDIVLFCSFGGGFTWGATLLKW